MKININDIKKWIKEILVNAKSKGVIVGMSGGKDSLVVAKLCADALGKENVLGIILPNGNMSDIDDAIHSCEILGIRYQVIDINKAVGQILSDMREVFYDENVACSTITSQNIPPRVRMTYFYAIAGSLNYLVANTSNLSEILTGYSTKWGDNVGDFSPLSNFTKSQVCEIGLALGLPKELVLKTPSDGLCGQSDEQKLGVSYEEIDSYIMGNKDVKNAERIEHLIKVSQHKRDGAYKYTYNSKEKTKPDELGD